MLGVMVWLRKIKVGKWLVDFIIRRWLLIMKRKVTVLLMGGRKRGGRKF